MCPIETYLNEAIETVSAWDLPDVDFADAINAQTKLMSGVNSDDYWRLDVESSLH